MGIKGWGGDRQQLLSALPWGCCLQKLLLPPWVMGDGFNIWFKIRKMSTMHQFMKGPAVGPWLWEGGGDQKSEFGGADAGGGAGALWMRLI